MSKTPGRGLARAAVVTIALWILAGALFKLLRGSPQDLPRLVRDLPLELGLTYKLVISAELCIGLLALLRPRVGWAVLALLLVVFDVILARQITAGEASCGCFGRDFPIPPWGMMVIDSVLLAALLATRPWSAALPRGAPVAVVLLLCLVAVASTWLLDRQLPDSAATAGGEPTFAPTRSWIELDVETWVGKELTETPLARWLDPYQFPPDALWVLWSQTCDYCARHLARLAQEESGERQLVLVQLEDPNDTEANRVVHVLPQGDFVFTGALPDSVQYVVTTPAELDVVEWKVVSAAEAVDEDGDEHED